MNGLPDGFELEDAAPTLPEGFELEEAPKFMIQDGKISRIQEPEQSEKPRQQMPLADNPHLNTILNNAVTGVADVTIAQPQHAIVALKHAITGEPIPAAGSRGDISRAFHGDPMEQSALIDSQLRANAGAPIPGVQGVVEQTIPRVAGNLVGLMSTAGANPAFGVTPLAVSVGTGAAADKYVSAKQAGATDAEATKAAGFSGAINAAAMGLLGPVARVARFGAGGPTVAALAAGAAPTVAQAAKYVALDAAGQAGIMGGAHLSSNAVDRLVYDPERPLTEGVGESMAMGAGFGLLHTPEIVSAAIRQTKPENVATLKTQQDEMVAGKRPAMLFTPGDRELPVPDGFARMKTKEGVFHYDPEVIEPAEIALAVDQGTIGDVLNYGISAKPDLTEPHTAVVRRDAQGNEIEAVVTDQTHLSQVLARQGERAEPGQTIATESPETVLQRRDESPNADELMRSLTAELPESRRVETKQKLTYGLKEDERNAAMQTAQDARLKQESEAARLAQEKVNAEEAAKRQAEVTAREQMEKELKEETLVKAPDDVVADMAHQGDTAALEELHARNDGNELDVQMALKAARDRQTERDQRAQLDEQLAREYEDHAGDRTDQGPELLNAIAQLGGLPHRDSGGLSAELETLREGIGTKMRYLFRARQTKSIDRIRDELADKGFAFDTPNDLLQAVDQRLRTGKPMYGTLRTSTEQQGQSGLVQSAPIPYPVSREATNPDSSRRVQAGHAGSEPDGAAVQPGRRLELHEVPAHVVVQVHRTLSQLGVHRKVIFSTENPSYGWVRSDVPETIFINPVDLATSPYKGRKQLDLIDRVVTEETFHSLDNEAAWRVFWNTKYDPRLTVAENSSRFFAQMTDHYREIYRGMSDADKAATIKIYENTHNKGAIDPGTATTPEMKALKEHLMVQEHIRMLLQRKLRGETTEAMWLKAGQMPLIRHLIALYERIKARVLGMGEKENFYLQDQLNAIEGLLKEAKTGGYQVQPSRPIEVNRTMLPDWLTRPIGESEARGRDPKDDPFAGWHDFPRPRSNGARMLPVDDQLPVDDHNVKPNPGENAGDKYKKEEMVDALFKRPDGKVTDAEGNRAGGTQLPPPPDEITVPTDGSRMEDYRDPMAGDPRRFRVVDPKLGREDDQTIDHITGWTRRMATAYRTGRMTDGETVTVHLEQIPRLRVQYMDAYMDANGDLVWQRRTEYEDNPADRKTLQEELEKAGGPFEDGTWRVVADQSEPIAVTMVADGKGGVHVARTIIDGRRLPAPRRSHQTPIGTTQGRPKAQAPISRALAKRVGERWLEIARNPRSFIFDLSLKEAGRDITDHIAQLNPILKGKVEMTEETHLGEREIILVDATSQATYRPYMTIHMDQQGAKSFYVCSVNMGGSKQGAAFYQGVLDWAHANGLKRVADPNGLTDTGKYRTTAHMASSILRHGDSKHVEPNQSHAFVFEGDAAHDAGAALLGELALMHQHTRGVFNDWRYDIGKDQYHDETGAVIPHSDVRDRIVQRLGTSNEHAAAKTGPATVKRALVTAALRDEAGTHDGRTGGVVLQDATEGTSPAGSLDQDSRLGTKDILYSAKPPGEGPAERTSLEKLGDVAEQLRLVRADIQAQRPGAFGDRLTRKEEHLKQVRAEVLAEVQKDLASGKYTPDDLKKIDLAAYRELTPPEPIPDSMQSAEDLPEMEEATPEWLRERMGDDEAPAIQDDTPKTTYDEKIAKFEGDTLKGAPAIGKWLEKLKGWMHGFMRVPELAGLKSGDKAMFVEGLSRLRQATKWIQQQAAERVGHVVEPFTKIEDQKAFHAAYDLFRKKVAYSDLYFRSKIDTGGTAFDGTAKKVVLPYEMTEADVARRLMEIQRDIDASPDKPEITEAIKRHYTLVEEVRTDLEKRKMPMPEHLKNPFYFPHKILEFWDGNVANVAKRIRGDFRGYLIDPVGSIKGIETDYVKAMYAHMAEVMAHNERADLVQRYWIDPYDKMEEARQAFRDALQRNPRLNWEAFVERQYPGYTRMVADPNLPLRWETIISPDAIMEKLGKDFTTSKDWQEKLAKMGIKITPEMVKEILTLSADKERFLVPRQIKEAVQGVLKRDQQAQDVGPLEHVVGPALTLWKQTILNAPWNLVRYQYGNVVGDLEKILTRDTRMVRYMSQALREVREYYKTNTPGNDKLREALKRGVLQSVSKSELQGGPGLLSWFKRTENVKDWGDLPEMKQFQQFASTKTLPRLFAMMREKKLNPFWWSQDLSEVREATFRYAKYLADLDRIQKGEEPNYAGALRSEVRRLADPYDKAAKIARDTFVDYDMISPNGDGLRRHLIPFYSWMEGNFRYHINMFRNMGDMAREGEFFRGMKTGLPLATGAVGLLARLAIPWVAIQLWNNRDEDARKMEADLSAADRRKFHITLGRDSETGEVKVVYANTALADFVDWFSGQQAAGRLIDMMAGRSTFQQAIADFHTEAAKGVANKVVQGIGPAIKIPLTAVLSRNTFPDAFDSRPIPAYEWRHAVMSQFDGTVANVIEGIVNKDFYAPKDFAGWAEQAILQVRRRDPAQWAYFGVKSDVDDWMDAKGLASEAGVDSRMDAQVKANFRRAIYRGDIAGATQWYSRLLDLGYTSERFNAMVSHQDPLGSLSKKFRQEYVSGLTDFQQEQLLKAYEYTARLREPSGDAQRALGRRLFPSEKASPESRERFMNDPRHEFILEQELEKRATISDETLDAAAKRLMKQSLQVTNR